MPIEESSATGKLFLVPTPIGNLQDITLRALEVLKNADAILCEDTRTSSVLLNHFQISRPLRSFHLHNEHQVLKNVVAQLKEGAHLALISDAGTPGISDPGFLLVRECVEAEIPIECLPGPTAFVPALVASGFPTDRFVFEGFLPLKKGRETRIKLMAEESRTTVFYESPHKLLKTLLTLKAVCLPERRICVAREISKLFESYFRGTIAEALDFFTEKGVRGEFVIVLQGHE